MSYTTFGFESSPFPADDYYSRNQLRKFKSQFPVRNREIAQGSESLRRRPITACAKLI